MRPIAFACLACAWLAAGACTRPADRSASGPDTPVSVDKPFVSGGRIDMVLGGGRYEIVAAPADRIRVTTSGHTGSTKVEVAAAGREASLQVTDTPHDNFHATIEVPKAADLSVHLAAGEMTIAPIAGNLDVDSTAGNLTIAVADANEYGSVDGSVKAGDIEAGPFGESKSGLLQHLAWSGTGKRTLKANLGAGKLVLRQP